MDDMLDLVTVEETSLQEVRRHYPMSGATLDAAESARSSLVNQALAQMGNVQNVIQTAKLLDAYKTVGDVVLQQLEDGTYSGTIRDEKGKILEHVKFEKASSKAIAAASFSYSVLNAAVGQANMMEIAERLAEIEAQLDEVKQRDYIDKINAIKSACDAFKEIDILKNDDCRLQTVILLREHLNKALGTIKAYILQDIKAMPAVEEPKWYENLGFRVDETKPEKAKKRFEYVAKLLPVWCQGMSQLVLTDAYFQKNEYPSARQFITELNEIVRDSGLPSKVQLVPMLGQVDPVKMLMDFDSRVDETEKAFARLSEKLNKEPCHLQILAGDIK